MNIHWGLVVLFSLFETNLTYAQGSYDDADDVLGPVIVMGGDAFRLNNEGVTKSYSEASDICDAFGWQLVRINSESKNMLITYLLSDAGMKGPFWTSSNRLGDDETWQLPDGTPLSYFNWREGQPDNEGGEEKCIEISNEGEWDDKPCDISIGFVCEEIDSGEINISI